MWKKGLKDGIPIFLGYFAVSITFGIAAKNAGVSVFEAALMSATNLTSAGQVAALDIIENSGSYVAMALSQLIINLRYCLMSSALSQKLPHKMPFFHRFIMSFGVTDEIFGVSVGVPDKLSPYYSYGLMSAAIPGWTLGTVLGVLGGEMLPVALGQLLLTIFGSSIENPTLAAEQIVASLGVAVYGMFISTIVPPARKSLKIAGIVVVSMLSSFAFSKLPYLCNLDFGFKIIILTILIAGVAAILFPVKDDDKEEEAEQ